MSATEYVDVTVPRVVADLLVGPEEPPYAVTRPVAATVNEGLAWIAHEPWPHHDLNSDSKRRLAVKRLMFARWLADRRRRDGR